MSLIKRSEWPLLGNGSLLSRLIDTDRFFDADWLQKVNVPAVNVKETDKSYEVELAVPGLTKKDFKVTAENGILTVSSEKSENREEKEKEYTRREFEYSSFSRSFTLPENVNEENIEAAYEDGVLKLNISKRELSAQRSKKAIEVK